MKTFENKKVIVTYPKEFKIEAQSEGSVVSFLKDNETEEVSLYFYSDKVMEVITIATGGKLVLRKDMYYPNNKETGALLTKVGWLISYVKQDDESIHYTLSETKIKQEEEEEMETMKDAIEADRISPTIKPIKDSGERYVNENGGMRDTAKGKPKFKYIDAVFLERVIEGEAIYFDNEDENVVYKLTYKKVLDVISLKEINYSRYEIIMIATAILLVNSEDENWEQQNLYDGLSKFALFMEEGAKKYSFENWKLLNTPEDLERFKESCYRHYIQWRLEEDDENHQMATVFNLMALYYHTNKNNQKEIE